MVRIGDDKVTPVDIRIITASNKNLPQLVAKGLFREDFFYRICVLKLRLPALRERHDDIPELVRHLLRSLPMDSAEPDDALLMRLSRYPWPGNNRQLGNVVERLAVMRQGQPFAASLLEDVLEDLSVSLPVEEGAAVRSELTVLQEVLSSVRGNREAAAKRLQISTTTLWRRMKKYLDEDPECFDGARY